MKAKCSIPKPDRKELKNNQLKGLRGACMTHGCEIEPWHGSAGFRKWDSKPGGCLFK